MTTLREAATQALDALSSSLYPQPRQMAAIAALRAALAEPVPDQHTHSERCWSWGPKHYECALKHIAELNDGRTN